MSAGLPAYSVLMPLAPWEPPRLLAASLTSLARQTLPPGEVIVSCDGSPPAPLREALQACGLPLHLVEGPGSEGVGPVLARGLLRCRHDLVLRMDADDLCLPHRCEWQVRALTDRPWLAALSAPLAEFEGDPQQISGRRSLPCGEERIHRFSRWRNPLNHPSVALRRSRVLAVGNYRDRPGFEDYDLWLRLLREGEQLDNLADVLVLARVGPAHLQRRRGWGYVRRETAFLWSCSKEGLIAWPRALLLLLTRVPLRLLPAALLSNVMGRWLRSQEEESAPSRP
jgi:glycosyltransferase involved in cell wall biosynthesis